MNMDQLKALANDEPFRPFVLESLDGNRIVIEATDRIVFPPPILPVGDLIFVYAPDGSVHHLTIQSVKGYAVLGGS